MGFLDDWVKPIGSFVGGIAPSLISLWQAKEDRDWQLEMANIQAKAAAQQPVYYPTAAPSPAAIPQVPYAQINPMPTAINIPAGPRRPAISGPAMTTRAPSTFTPLPLGGAPAMPGIPAALPGGAPAGLGDIAQQIWNFPGVPGLMQPSVPAVPSGPTMVPGQGFFRAGVTGARALSTVIVQNPATGQLVWYRNMGRPILWAGDLSACKRVKRVASKARRYSRPR
jgi:hypothetical protein